MRHQGFVLAKQVLVQNYYELWNKNIQFILIILIKNLSTAKKTEGVL